MRVITEPTVLADSDDVQAIQKDGRPALQALLDSAFAAGQQHATTTPAPQAIMSKQPEKIDTISLSVDEIIIPELRTWEEVREDAPSNPIERFQLDQTPPEGVDLWNAQLMNALKYAVKKYGR